MKTLLAFLLLASAALAWYQVPATTASLSGTANSSAVAANLTTEGAADWIHWGGAVLNRKSGGGAQISTFMVVGRGMVHPYDDDPRPLSWADGAPAASSNKNVNGVFISGVGNGFRLSAPADATRRTLVLHVGGWKSGGTLRAHLSDGSVADYLDTTAPVTGSYNRNYTLTYQAGGPKQTLEITWTMAAGEGNVTVSAAALSAALSNTGPPAVVKLEWDPPVRTSASSDVVLYRIYRSTDPKNFPGSPIAEIPISSGPTYSDTDVRRGQTFYYQIRTVSRAGLESVPTNMVQTAAPVDPCATAPLVITGLKWPETRAASRSLSWDSATRTVVSVSYSWPVGLTQSAVFTDDRGCTFLAKN